MTENGQTIQRISAKELDDVLTHVHVEKHTKLVLVGPEIRLSASPTAWTQELKGYGRVFQLTEFIDNL